MKKLWQTGWRVGLCALLLLWIFHSIFVNEARLAHPANEWAQLTRQAQWRLGWSEGPARLWQTLTLIQPGAFALSFVLMGCTVALGVMRWRMVLRVQGIDLPFSRAAEISLVAQFFNSFLLGSTGGDLMKAWYAARETHHKKTEAVVTVFVDRLVGLWAMLLFAGVMMIPNFRPMFLEGFGPTKVSGPAGLVILGMLAGCTVVGFLAFRGGVSKRWSGARSWLRRLPKGAKLEQSLDSCRKFGREPFFLTRTLGLSMLLNVICVLQWIVVGRGLGLTIATLPMFVTVPTVICIAALPITPSGLGVRETLFVHMLDEFLKAGPALATAALSLSLLAYAGSLAWSLIGGVVYVTLKRKHHLSEADLDPPNGG